MDAKQAKSVEDTSNAHFHCDDCNVRVSQKSKRKHIASNGHQAFVNLRFRRQDVSDSEREWQRTPAEHAANSCTDADGASTASIAIAIGSATRRRIALHDDVSIRINIGCSSQLYIV